MKYIKISAVILLATLLNGCTQTRYITERYIKTSIESHELGKYSNIKTFPIFKRVLNGGKAYLELTGYKYANNKALVIGADKYYSERPKFKGDESISAQITFIELNIEQCQAIVSNYKILQDKIKAERPKINEEVYHDYSVSKDLFISYKKSRGSSTVTYINFWIKGEKYRVPTKTIINKLNKFLDY